MKLVSIILVTMVLSSLHIEVLASEKETPQFAFPDKYMLRVGAYYINDTNTKIGLNPTGGGIGTLVDFNRDLGAESELTIPRIDAYYRFNERHRIDFTAFSVNRKGNKTLIIDIDLEDQSYSVGEVLNSDVKYTLYKVGYSYSFYHSPKVELSLSAGLNIAKYDMSFTDSTGTKTAGGGVTAPLPVLGLNMGYAITPKWSAHFLVETFFLNIDDKLRATVLNFELNTEYRIWQHFAVGAGIARLGTEIDVDAPDFGANVTDAYNGFTLFGTFYF